MLEADLREIWRYGKLNRGVSGAGVTVVGIREGGSSPQEFHYVRLDQLPETAPAPILGACHALQAADGQVVFIVDRHRKTWRMYSLSPALELVDVWETFMIQSEQRSNERERRKTGTRRRKSGT
jgi:hypothetical protein